ncbi:MAG: CBS domain-containing protein [Planctomycetes bacterium]|nr:CBS domain-containing protein [Planctomycetota bacterium]
MNAVATQLQQIRVADIMSREVVTISANADMSKAARLLFEHRISGAPVVDERGKCVGVLSLFDFARRDQSVSLGKSLPPLADEFVLRRDSGSGTVSIEHATEGYVREHMNTAVQSIDSEQSLIDAARYMHREGIHRLIVLDEASCPVAVVSTLDILAALVDLAEK